MGSVAKSAGACEAAFDEVVFGVSWAFASSAAIISAVKKVIRVSFGF